MFESAYLPSWAVQAFVSVYLTVALAATTATLYIWRRYKKVDGIAHDELRDRSRTELKAQLGALLDEIIDGDRLRSDGGIDREEIDGLLDDYDLTEDEIVELVERGTRYLDVVDRHRRRVHSYRDSYRSFALLALNAFALAMVVLVSGMVGNEPFSWAWDVAHLAMGLTAAAMLFRGITHFRDANRLEREL